MDWLLSLLLEQILQHAYEHTVRRDILFAMEYTTSSDNRVVDIFARPDYGKTTAQTCIPLFLM